MEKNIRSRSFYPRTKKRCSHTRQISSKGPPLASPYPRSYITPSYGYDNMIGKYTQARAGISAPFTTICTCTVSSEEGRMMLPQRKSTRWLILKILYQNSGRYISLSIFFFSIYICSLRQILIRWH